MGNTANTVVVTGDVDLVTPVDSGEKSDRLTIKELENFIQVGTNAAEFLKIMPGFAISNGTSNIGELHRTDRRHQRQRRRRQPEPAEQRVFL